jgi:outer membrane protein assembly factor BamB
MDTDLAKWSPQSVEWPGFRGASRNSRVTESLPALDWDESPPRELWRRLVGPAWSSMAIVSGRLFTQEQRGDQEVVTCYNAETGDPLWVHGEPSRFEEVTSGAGPRATPTYSNGHIFAYGARGILAALEAATGAIHWRHDLMSEVNAQLPIWGFASSPAVVEDLVIVYAGGDGQNGLLAFDCDSGAVRWRRASRGMNFGSVQPANFAGFNQVVFIQAGVALGLSATTGEEMWRYQISEGGNPPIVQPQQIDARSLLIPLGDGVGVARIEVTREPDGSWAVAEQWRSRHLKPSFNDFVFHEGTIFGFDRQIYSAVDAATGRRLWKRGRFGFGQTLLLEASRQVIVTTETGRAVLLDAAPDKLRARGRLECLRGKTWNHPAIANGRLYIRNSAEMVCYVLN